MLDFFLPSLIMSWIWALTSESRLSQVSSVDNECKLLKKAEYGEENRRIDVRSMWITASIKQLML